MKWIELLVAILSGLVICIPLAAQLVENVREAVQEKNWANLLGMVMQFMAEAEQSFSSGVQKKAFVMAQLEAAAAAANYNLTDESRDRISAMIDAMCAMAKVVNVG